MKINTLLVILFVTFFSSNVNAQKDTKIKKGDPFKSKEAWNPIPLNRQGFHAYIDKIQKNIDAIDGAKDNMLDYAGNKRKSEVLTEALFKKVDAYQIIIENLDLEHWDKVRHLKDLETDLKGINQEFDLGKFDEIYIKDNINAFIEILKLKLDKKPIAPYINDNFTVGMYGLLHMFKDDKDAVSALYNKMVVAEPEKMKSKLGEIINEPAADVLIANLAKKSPALILTYATSTSIERDLVMRNQDPLVKTIANIATKTKKPLRALPFLDELQTGELTFDEMNKVIDNPQLYYARLIKSRLKSPALARRILDRDTKLEALVYVREMNELHDKTDAIRFKCIDNLTAAEMYYLMVMCSDEIYTSTFTGTFKRMMEKMAPQAGDHFLDSLNKDKFRTFIRMCAGYNRLDQFLGTMKDENKNILMSSFVKNIDLDKETDLEDAVDVADALGSISDKKTLEFLQSEIEKDYERTYKLSNKRGLIIYFLLHTLTSSILNPNDSTNQLQDVLKVPPINYVPYASLVNDSGIIVEQVFFYGDDDGKQSFANFLTNFPTTNWKQEKNDKWIHLTSIKGKPIEVFANFPLEEPKDEEAQNAMIEHMYKNNFYPSFVVHRGHSYHLPTTIGHLSEQNKIVLLGSCGGYHNLSTILGISADAHIISSKQTGTMWVNDPIIHDINEKLSEGKDINWLEIWKNLGIDFTKSVHKDKFNDYVPPHKNMGALFLKAFKIQMEENG